VGQLSDTIEKLLDKVFSMRSVLTCYKKVTSNTELVVIESPASKDVNTEADEAMALEAVTWRQPVRTHQPEDFVHVVVNC
jgi:hypothetical protein